MNLKYEQELKLYDQPTNAPGVYQKIAMHIVWLIALYLVVLDAPADDSLWQRLKQDPYMIVLMRNSESSGNRERVNMLQWDASGKCEGESMLTNEGRAHAKNVGDAFLAHGIEPIVISSPMCRCTETAKIAFGEYLTDPELRQRYLDDAGGQSVFEAKVTELFSEHRGRTPIAFVNHRPNIDTLTMELIDIGDLLVGTVSETGEVEIVGKIRVEP